jgi:chromatin segregation and condensation protein Rec8/ScpA/Scc1 (kleisin family)
MGWQSCLWVEEEKSQEKGRELCSRWERGKREKERVGGVVARERKRKGKQSRVGEGKRERDGKEKKEEKEKKGRERMNLTLIGQIFGGRNHTVICVFD